jgi:hypothetical protein
MWQYSGGGYVIYIVHRKKLHYIVAVLIVSTVDTRIQYFEVHRILTVLMAFIKIKTYYDTCD